MKIRSLYVLSNSRRTHSGDQSWSYRKSKNRGNAGSRSGWVNPQAAQAAVAGEIQVLIISLPSIEAFVKAGKLRIIGVSSSKRFPQLPDTPTLAEHHKGLVVEGRFILMAPTGTPTPIVDRINREVDRMLKDPEAVQRIRGFGFSTSDAMSPKTLIESIREARETWRRIAHDIKLQPE